MDVKEEPSDGYMEKIPGLCLDTELMLEYDGESGDIQPEIKLEPANNVETQKVPVEQGIPVDEILHLNTAKKRTATDSTNGDDSSAKKTQEYDGSSSNETSHVPRSPIKKPRYYRNQESLREQYMKLEKTKMKLLEDHVKNELWFKDEDYHFLMSLHPQMKSFSPLQKLQIRQKITQILINETKSLSK